MGSRLTLVDDFINLTQKTITEQGDDFCIILNAGKQYPNRPIFVYKSIEDFKEKGQKGIDSIDTDFVIEAVLWYFD